MKLAHRRPAGRRAHRRLQFLMTGSILAGLLGYEVPLAHAQLAPPIPVRTRIDGNNVDVLTGKWKVTGPTLSVGTPDAGITFYTWNFGSGWSNTAQGFLTLTGSTMTVSIGDATDDFSVSGATYTSLEGNGATLSFDGSGKYTYVSRDGTIAHFTTKISNAWNTYGSTAVISDLTRPNGEVVTYSYESITFCDNWKAGNTFCTHHGNAFRLSSLTTSSGYRLTFTNADTSSFSFAGDDGSTDAPIDTNYRSDLMNWLLPRGVGLYNLASSATAPVATQSFTVPAEGIITQIQDNMGNAYNYNYGTVPTSVTNPASSVANLVGTYDPSSGRYTAIKNAVGTTTYSSSDNGAVRTVVATDSLSHASTYSLNTSSNTLTSFTDALGKTTSYSYDGYGRVTLAIAPELNQVITQYDARGNVTQVTQVAKPNTGLTNVVTTAGYDSSCTVSVKCNKPNWTRDALGNQTDYTYDTTHGGVLTVTQPADPVGDRPQTRYSYTAMQAFYDNGSGSISASGQPTYKLTGVSVCRFYGSCVGGGAELRSAISYGPQSAGTGNNLLPVSKTVSAGDGTFGGTTTASYDAVGNVSSTTDALGNSTVYHYDADRRLLGVVYPDPDGPGPRTPLARQYKYNQRGAKWIDSVGTVTDQSDAAWNNYSETYHNYAQLDDYDRIVRTTVWTNGVDYAVNDYLYDAAGNKTCTVQYMNPSNWGPQAGSCTPLQTTGPYGPDRVTQTTYDALNRPSRVTEGIGTPAQGVTGTVGYTDNGQKAYVIDGNNNRTSYLYDGFDRPSQTQFPSSSTGANASNSGDFEAVLAYDANGRQTQTRLRDGTTIGLTYDNLGRQISRVVQNNITNISDYQVNTTYDMLGDVTTVTRPADNLSSIFDYDILGRPSGERQTFGSVSYQFDLNGRRTAETWSDGFYVNYDYDNLGLVTAIRENGATSGVGVLARYSYDSAARRTAVNFGNGTARYYGYDPVSRLTGLQLTFPNGISNNLIGGLNGSGTPINYSPANQIASIARSNDGFSWTDARNAVRDYGTNGLNQYTGDGQVSFGYDGRGNLTSSGSLSFAYNKENQLISASGSPTTSIYYDPLGRISEYDTTSSTRFFYSGNAIAAEVSNPDSSILRRYVMGPGTDEAVVWYEGSGTSDRRFLQADERGSVVAITDSGGNVVEVNKYDEYGIPGGNNIGRFQYTGQAWYGEVGLYNFKARWYSPSLGRFMQTDPIGYGDGLNWHNYAHSDPINGSDPSGTFETTSSSGTDGGGSFIEVPGHQGPAPDTSFTWPSSASFIGGGLTDNPLNDGTSTKDIVVTAYKPKTKISQQSIRSVACGVGTFIKGVGDTGMELGLAGAAVGAVGGAIGGGVPGALAGASPGLALVGTSSDVSTGGQLIMDLAGAHSLSDVGVAGVRAGFGFAGGRVLQFVAPGLYPGWLDKAQQTFAKNLGNAAGSKAEGYGDSALAKGGC